MKSGLHTIVPDAAYIAPILARCDRIERVALIQHEVFSRMVGDVNELMQTRTELLEALAELKLTVSGRS